MSDNPVESIPYDSADWLLWGDQASPYAAGAEAKVKQAYFECVANTPADEQLYLQDPNGNEFEYDGKKWVQI